MLRPIFINAPVEHIILAALFLPKYIHISLFPLTYDNEFSTTTCECLDCTVFTKSNQNFIQIHFY